MEVWDWLDRWSKKWREGGEIKRRRQMVRRKNKKKERGEEKGGII